MPAFYAGKRVGKPLMGGHTYNAMFNGKLVWPLDKDTVVSINITDDKGKPLPKSLAVNGTDTGHVPFQRLHHDRGRLVE